MEDARYFQDGKLVIHRRNGIYQARIAVGPNRYLHRTLKTRDAREAKEKGHQLFYETNFKIIRGEAVFDHSVSKTIAEYLAFREKEHLRGKTKGGMLRQLKRTLKFWDEFVGTRGIDSIGNADLESFVEWRRDYYLNRPLKHPNAKVHPTDKEIQFNIMSIKAVIRWAQDKGYRGAKPLPTFAFTPKNVRVRPAFSTDEYKKLWQTSRKWAERCEDSRHVHTRWLLHNYILILGNSGIRVGEANALRIADISKFTDDKDRENYRLIVRGKTGERDVIIRANSADYIDRMLELRTGASKNDFLFAMADGSKIKSLTDQFDKVLALGGITHNANGQKFCLYSLRHFYAVQALRKGIDVYAVARNMGTSVEMIQKYYGKQATPLAMAGRLGD